MAIKYIRGFAVKVPGARSNTNLDEETLLNMTEENGKYSLEIDGVAQLNGGKKEFLVQGVDNKDALEKYGEYWTRMYSRGTEGKNYEEWLKTNFKSKK